MRQPGSATRAAGSARASAATSSGNTRLNTASDSAAVTRSSYRRASLSASSRKVRCPGPEGANASLRNNNMKHRSQWSSGAPAGTAGGSGPRIPAKSNSTNPSARARACDQYSRHSRPFVSSPQRTAPPDCTSARDRYRRICDDGASFVPLPRSSAVSRASFSTTTAPNLNRSSVASRRDESFTASLRNSSASAMSRRPRPGCCCGK